MANPTPHEPTDQMRRMVESMSAYGIPQDKIATVIGIDAKTLRKYYRTELDTADVKANSKVAESLYRKATGDGAQSVTAAIFWLKTRAGWKDTSEVRLTGKDGGAIQTEEVGAAATKLAAFVNAIAERSGKAGEPPAE